MSEEHPSKKARIESSNSNIMKQEDFVNLSWVPVEPNSHFPLQNLPFGVFREAGAQRNSIAVAIGTQILSLRVLSVAGLLSGIHLQDGNCFQQETLNAFMSLGRSAWTEARNLITNLLSKDCAILRDDSSLRERALLSQDSVTMQLPAQIGDYTDFYSSRYHATNVGIMLRGEKNALQENWLHLPVGYHGRSSSVVVSGVDVRRPSGQIRPQPEQPPIYAPCKLLDFELEMAFFVGPKSEMGEPIGIDEAEQHLFGLVLMNDWSARDIQKWEYVPLGPFNGKNFGTSISPWIVTFDALAPFKVKSEKQKPEPLAYLKDREQSAYDIKLSVAIQPNDAEEPFVVCRSNSKNLYWSFKQQLVHHTSTGCPVNPGDLMGSGTISGPELGSYGSMLELCWKGTRPLMLPDGSERKFLADGDRVIMNGYCESEKLNYRIGFGQVSSCVLPALAL